MQGFYSDDLSRFDCVPTEGLLTDSQQNMYYQELKELLTRFPEMFQGIITPDMLVKASPMQFKVPTLQAIQRASQARQQQTKATIQSQRLTDQLTQSLSAVQVAQAQENIADAQVKRSEIPLNRAKTVSELNKNLFDPVVKLIKEQVRLEIAQEKQLEVAGSAAGR